MKNSIYQLLTYGIIGIFLLYWIAVFILLLPNSYAKNVIVTHAPRFKNTFGNTWRLFSPLFRYHNRLYYVVREQVRPEKTDTIEVLAKISRDKQKRAPFNQADNILDHLVNNNVAGLLRIVWQNKKKPGEEPASPNDSAYIAEVVSAAASQKKYLNYLGTLKNYGNKVLKDHHIDPVGKEMKIIVKEALIKPFLERNNDNFSAPETLVFETPFEPLHP